MLVDDNRTTKSLLRLKERNPPSLANGLVGGTLAGRFEVWDVLDSAPSRTVYRAFDTYLHRNVMLIGPLAGPKVDDLAEYVPSDVCMLAGFRHPNIATVHDIIPALPNTMFVVMQYIEGAILSQRMRNEFVSVLEIAEFVAKIADALGSAHDHRLIHRWLSPGRIIVDAKIQPHLFDFFATRPHSVSTSEGTADSLLYRSPEELSGKPLFDARRDIFSLGVIFYELLTGKHPFQGETPSETRRLILVANPPRPALFRCDVPQELERICLKALAVPLARRYPTALQMSREILEYLGGR